MSYFYRRSRQRREAVRDQRTSWLEPCLRVLREEQAAGQGSIRHIVMIATMRAELARRAIPTREED